MAESKPLRTPIIDIKKTCPNGHQIGQEWIVKHRTPKGICLGSFGTCLLHLTALRFGASFPWEDEEGVITIGCPDHTNQVVWRLERLDAAVSAD